MDTADVLQSVVIEQFGGDVTDETESEQLPYDV